MTATKPETIDEYIAAAPEQARDSLSTLRTILHRAVPGGTEKVRYGMPAIMLGGRYAIHFAGWKKHIGLYPIPTLPEPLESEIAPYRQAKDSVNFPYSKPIPFDLIERVATQIVALRADATDQTE
ncbi:iron chaperone [Herbiconiux sp. L3-i23]|uniref:iron chaperone n=1 Tax=Herbiconiux sp. L3-i23 TaxID=2905871 RepID=UPI002072DB8E|nr:DUF1801 domain-containing protein [Herbiconiux sp. L3-i23]